MAEAEKSHSDISISDEEIDEILSTEAKFRRECRRREAAWLKTRNNLPAKVLLSEDTTAILKTLGRLRPLTHDETIDCSRRYHAGEDAYRKLGESDIGISERRRLQRLAEMGDLAKQQMIICNIALVILLGNRHSHGSLAYPDYLQAGISGLIRAVELYDYTSGCAFSTYATFWIEKALRDARIFEEWLIRLPKNPFTNYQKILYAEYNTVMPDGRVPTDKDIAKLLGITEDMVRLIKRVAGDQIALDQPIDTETDGNRDIPLGEALVDESIDIVKDIEQAELSERMNDLIANLSEDELYILKHITGMGGVSVLSLAEIGEHFGLTGQAVKYRWKKVLAKLRRNPIVPGLKVYLAA